MKKMAELDRSSNSPMSVFAATLSIAATGQSAA